MVAVVVMMVVVMIVHPANESADESGEQRTTTRRAQGWQLHSCVAGSGGSASSLGRGCL